jgi:hypothetical protein
MKKNIAFYILFIGIVLIIGIYVFYLKESSSNALSESKAISILKNVYPEFNSYPDNNLPPKSISTENNESGWYVAFVQEGSGRPILGAKCFFVNNDGSIHTIGEFKPSIEDINFSIENCSK